MNNNKNVYQIRKMRNKKKTHYIYYFLKPKTQTTEKHIRKIQKKKTKTQNNAS